MFLNKPVHSCSFYATRLMLSQNGWLSVSDFIVLVPFIFLLLHFFKNHAFNRNQSHLYIKQTLAIKTMSLYFQILTLLLFNLGQVIRTPFILLVLFLPISLMRAPEKFNMIRGMNNYSCSSH